MVQSKRVSTIGKNSWTIKLPIGVDSINTRENRSIFDSLYEVCTVITVYSFERANFISYWKICFASTHYSIKTIVFLKSQAEISSVIQSKSIEPTIAALIPIFIRAIYDLLFRKIVIFIFADEIRCLYVTNRGKSITRITLPLIFNRCHFPTLHPVNSYICS